ncbi:MAG: hypothetical protein EBQ56_00920, partial [Proteobacteria bacterium]|nr:hypothetical protein [Pseudomonadota bacterium]
MSELTSRYSGPSAGLGMMRPRAVTTNLPTSFASITAGGSHTCALTAAGAAWCWGANNNGQLGDGTTLGSTVPVAVTGGNTFASISAGAGFTCGLTADGTAYCWGYNGNGQLGIGTTTSTGIPTAVSGSLKFAGVTSGGGHACGWTVAKVAYCWGSNGSGQVGVNADLSNPMPGMNSNVTSPQAVQGQTSFTSVSAGESHTCGVTATGTAYCWGSNQNGQLGNGLSASWVANPVPSVVTGLLKFQSVTAGGMHSCGIVESGRAYCWGANSSGNLGDNTTTARNTPAAVFDTGTYTKLSLGYGHSCGIKLDWSQWCWGENYGGQIGDGTTAIATSPVLVKGIQSSISLALGVSHTCSLAPDGRATCWGENNWGQVGDGLDSVRPTPVKVTGAATFTSVIAGGWHTCGRTSMGVTQCWGWNAKGQVGDGTTTNRAAPVTVGTGGSTTQFAKVSGGLYHTCGLDSSGAAYCWGSGEFGGLGDGRFGTGTLASTPVAVTGGQTFASISAGHESACATDESSSVWCWGKNGSMSWQPDQSNSVTAPQRATLSIGTGIAVASGYHTGRVRYCALIGGLASCVGIDTPGVAPTVSLASIVAGGNHFCGLTVTSDAWCWGSNDYGQLGNGTTSSMYGAMSGPAQVTGGLKFSSLAAGGAFTCGLTADGTAHCWGSNDYRQLGDGTSAYLKANPTAVSTTLKFSILSLGSEHACGIAKDGATYCWGNAYYGQVGDGTFGYRTAPTLVFGQSSPPPTPTIPSAFSSVSAGSSHSCGLSAAGVAWCWGAGASGQVGDGTTTSRATPVAVLSFLTFRALTLGGLHTCGLALASGTYCWGDNSAGQLGSGASGQGMKHLNQSSPVAVVSEVSFASLVAGWVHTCGLTAQGEAYCWGDRYSGQVGDGPVSGYERTRTSPVKVSGGLKFSTMVAGGNHTCGLTSSGTAYCWGQNSSGQIGDSTTTNQYAPVAVSGSLAFQSLAAHGYQTCGIGINGLAYCWGRNDLGQLGDGTRTNRTTPTRVSTPRTFSSLAIGQGFICGLETSGIRTCWGANDAGQYGDGTTDSSNSPRTLSSSRQLFSLVAGDAYACGQFAQSGWSCWGDNTDGQLGDGTSASKPVPTRVQGSLTFASVSVGGNHTCAVTASSDAWCWGANESGQIGDDSTIARTAPTRVGGGIAFASISAGATHTCGVTATGQAYCWGSNQSSQLGDGTTVAARTFPVPVAGAERFAAVSAFANQTCGVTLDGITRCWGGSSTWKWSGATESTTPKSVTYGLDHACNLTSCWGGEHVASVGLLGNGAPWGSAQQSNISSPTAFSSVDAGLMHTCGLSASGNIYCWGANDHGELGDGTMRDRWTPVKVSGTTAFAAVSAGTHRTCALSLTGEAWCWGQGVYGSNGDGTLGYRSTPVLVSGQADQPNPT